MSKGIRRDNDGNVIVPVQVSRRGFLVGAGVLGLGTLALGPFLAACGAATDSSGANAEMDRIRKGGTLTFAIDGTNGVIDPAVYTTLGDWLAVDAVANGLTVGDFAKGGWTPGLAETIETSADGLTVTMRLREAVAFHDGSILTAQDVLRSLNRQIVDGDPTLPANSSRPLRGATARNILEITAADDQTVRFRLERPDVVFSARLSHISGRILSSTALDAQGAAIGENLIGSGAFKVASLAPQQSITLDAFPEFWGGAPVIDRLVLQQVVDSAALNAGLQSGQINASSFVVHSAAKSLEANPAVTVYDTPKGVNIFVMMNVTTPLLADLDVRKAINLCIDRATIVENAFFGYAEEPNGYTLNSSKVGHDPELADLSTYDLDAAKALIASAGAAGKSVSLIAQNNGWYPRAAQILEENLKAIGLVPSIELLDAGSFSGRFFDLAGHELALWERNGYVPDPDEQVGNMLSSTGSYGSRATGTATLTLPAVAEVDQLLVAATQTNDAAARKAAYTQAQRLYADEIMATAMVAYTQNIVASNGATDIGETSLSSQRFQIEKAALTS